MGNDKKIRCENLRNEKGFYEKIRDPYSKASIRITGLAREIEKVYKYVLYYNVTNNVTIRDKK